MTRFETQRQQLRTDIARSRRRLEQRARQVLGMEAAPLLFASRRGGSLPAQFLWGAGYALASWVLGSSWFTSWWQRVVSPRLTSWLARWARPSAASSATTTGETNDTQPHAAGEEAPGE